MTAPTLAMVMYLPAEGMWIAQRARDGKFIIVNKFSGDEQREARRFDSNSDAAQAIIDAFNAESEPIGWDNIKEVRPGVRESM